MLINIIIVLITLLTCSYYDLKRKTVPKWALYPMIIIGFFLNLLVMALHPDPLFKYTNLFMALVIFMIALISYEKKWEFLGGADYALFIGIILMTPIEFMMVEYYLGFFLFTCICGLVYYAIMKAANKKNTKYIKFVPCILVGYVVTVLGLFGPSIMAMIP